MATTNYRLQVMSADLFIKYASKEREYITQKITNLKSNLNKYFTTSISEILIFGSFKRDTILPRNFDENSDIDILIIFNQAEKELTPETYRNRLKKFTELYYSTSTVIRSHPSIVLEMDKIKFDLVPCRIYQGFFSSTHQIPDKNGSWMNTDPKGFNETLTTANNKYNSLVKPMIRLMKRWNAYNNYPYTSYNLEQIIADMNFSNDNHETGFLYAISQLPTSNLAEYQTKKVETLKNNGKWVKEYLDRDNQEKAIEVVCRILGLKV